MKIISRTDVKLRITLKAHIKLILATIVVCYML